MEKQEIKKKTLELAEELFGLVDKKIDKALNSGSIDTDSYENDYLLPKIILHAIMMDCVDNTRPLTASYAKEARNIYDFI